MSKPKTDTVEVMTDKQAALLRELAIDAYEPEAFRPNLTKAEAELRINVLKAKLKLMGEPRTHYNKQFNPVPALNYFLGPSTLLSTIFRASAKACSGVGNGGVAAS